jgi:hypothetical protein
VQSVRAELPRTASSQTKTVRRCCRAFPFSNVKSKFGLGYKYTPIHLPGSKAFITSMSALIRNGVAMKYRLA